VARIGTAGPGRLELPLERGALHLFVVSDQLIRVAYAKSGESLEPDRGWTTTLAGWPDTTLVPQEQGQRLALETTHLRVEIDRETGDVAFFDRARRPLLVDHGGQSSDAQRRALRARLRPEERCYGLGEKTGPLDQRGRRLQMWTTDPLFPCPQGYTSSTDPLYQAHPLLIGLHEAGAYGVYLNSTARTHFDLGASVVDELRLESEGRPLDYVFIYGPALREVVRRYTALVGRPELPPLWALGYQQCRWSYAPEQRVRTVAAELRGRQIPADGLWLDIDYMDGFRCFTWDADGFPDPPALVDDLRREGFHTVAILDPGIKRDEAYAVYREGLADGHFVRRPDGELYEGRVWPGATVYPDFTRPATRAWWSDRVEVFARESGLSGIWIDMNEPVTWDPDGFALDTVFDSEGTPTDHREARNVYALLMARATAEGLGRVVDRPFVLTRSGFSGVQRYAAVWTGDMASSWEHLQMAPAMLMNLGLSGVALCGTDVGGFSGGPSAELYIRWLQLGAFSPFFRGHVCQGAPDQEPWAFGAEIEGIAREQIELRYRLLPYLYSLIWQATQSGAPLLRPLVYEFQHDQRTHQLDDQFMVGPFLLVAPVLHEGQRERSVYLPPGRWYEGLTGQRPIEGGRTVQVEAPLQRLPIFVRAGAILPSSETVQHVGQRPADTLVLDLYPDLNENHSSFTLYRDDGSSSAYREGAYAVHEFALSAAGSKRHLSIRTERDQYRGPEQQLMIRLLGQPCERLSLPLPASYAVQIERQA
jgi:alpha-glucosidase